MSKSSEKKKLWKQLSELIRTAHPNCELCNKKGTQVHHIISKFYAKSILRFAPENLVVVCASCHFKFHKNPVQTMDWFFRKRNHDWQKVFNILGGQL